MGWGESCSVALLAKVQNSRSFNEMKLVKTTLRNRFCDETLDEAMRVNIDRSETLMDEDLDTIR